MRLRIVGAALVSLSRMEFHRLKWRCHIFAASLASDGKRPVAKADLYGILHNPLQRRSAHLMMTPPVFRGRQTGCRAPPHRRTPAPPRRLPAHPHRPRRRSHHPPNHLPPPRPPPPRPQALRPPPPRPRASGAFSHRDAPPRRSARTRTRSRASGGASRCARARASRGRRKRW